MPKFRLYVETGFVGCKHEDVIEIDDDEWSKMSDVDRESSLMCAAVTLMENHVEYGYEKITEA